MDTQKLVDVLKKAQQDINSMFDTQKLLSREVFNYLDDILKELDKPAPKPVQSITHKWEGKKCGACGHSHTLHVNGGLCTKVNCDCFSYIPTDEEV